ncbi:MAG: hypothetical protein WAK82_17555 [Streptosporangiaceae bacterium]
MTFSGDKRGVTPASGVTPRPAAASAAGGDAGRDGLTGMAERLRLLDGTLWVGPDDDGQWS